MIRMQNEHTYALIHSIQKRILRQLTFEGTSIYYVTINWGIVNNSIFLLIIHSIIITLL